MVAAGGRAGAVWQVLVQNAPKVFAALQLAERFLTDHPEVPTWVRRRVHDVGDRIAQAQARRSEAARIRGTLEIVRETAQDLSARDDLEARTGMWLRRADDIERALRLAESRAKRERKKMVVSLKVRTDTLAADLVEVLTDVEVPPRRGADAADGPRQVTDG